MLFFTEYKDAMTAANPSAVPHEISRLIAERWKELPPEKSRAYSVLSAAYAESKKNPSSTKRKRERRERDPKAPKSATSAYYYSKHHRMVLKQENAELSFGDLGKTVGAMWKAATPEEKKPFEELAAADRDRFNTEIQQYRAEIHKAPTEGAGSDPSPKQTKLDPSLDDETLPETDLPVLAADVDAMLASEPASAAAASAKSDTVITLVPTATCDSAGQELGSQPSGSEAPFPPS